MIDEETFPLTEVNMTMNQVSNGHLNVCFAHVSRADS
jgi:hypothetical protein